MNGLIITKVSKLGPILNSYRCEIWSQGKITTHTHRLAGDAGQAIEAFGLAQREVTWLSGPAATKVLARKFNLAYRKRAPGAGRKAIEQTAKVKRVTIWMTPSGIAEFKKQAETRGHELGRHVEQLVMAEENRHSEKTPV